MPGARQSPIVLSTGINATRAGEHSPAHADSRGESINIFINRAIDHEMERDVEGGEQK